jgi:DNA gyrase subunit A
MRRAWEGEVMQRDNELSLAEEIRQTEEQLRIYDGLTRAMTEPHTVLEVLLQAEDPESASAALRDRFGFDPVQATAVLEMQFRRATRLDRLKIEDRQRELSEHAAYLKSLSVD